MRSKTEIRNMIDCIDKDIHDDCLDKYRLPSYQEAMIRLNRATSCNILYYALSHDADSLTAYRSLLKGWYYQLEDVIDDQNSANTIAAMVSMLDWLLESRDER